MRYLVTGGAGFIGSHLAEALSKGNEVVVLDNLSSGKREFIKPLEKGKGFEFVKGDLLKPKDVEKALEGVDFVYHIAANPDIRYGISVTDTDLKQGTVATYNLLEAMRKAGVGKIAFSSSSTVYGEPSVVPVPEDYGPLMPISLYGASKLGAEGLITSFSHTFDMQAWIFRFANVIGPRGTHGVIFDFIQKLKGDPKNLEILGDGTQSKSYLMVDDVVDAMRFGVAKSRAQTNIYNLGAMNWVTVARIGEIVVEECGLKKVKINYTGGKRGWKGDVPKIMLDPAKMAKLGWKASRTSEASVRLATKSLVKELW
ncbi:MAG: NAD-dependent epimerase/dehydratase family protein [Methanobacteriota archaeon]